MRHVSQILAYLAVFSVVVFMFTPSYPDSAEKWGWFAEYNFKAAMCFAASSIAIELTRTK
jgi:hypothetical protein